MTSDRPRMRLKGIPGSSNAQRGENGPGNTRLMEMSVAAADKEIIMSIPGVLCEGWRKKGWCVTKPEVAQMMCEDECKTISADMPAAAR